MTLTRRNAIALFPTSIVAVSGFSQSGAAQTSDPPREIQTLIDNHINGFNTQNIKLFLGVFGDTAIIIDGIAPYRWLNPNAPRHARSRSSRLLDGVSTFNFHQHLPHYELTTTDSKAIRVLARQPIDSQTVARTGTLAYT